VRSWWGWGEMRNLKERAGSLITAIAPHGPRLKTEMSSLGQQAMLHECRCRGFPGAAWQTLQTWASSSTDSTYTAPSTAQQAAARRRVTKCSVCAKRKTSTCSPQPKQTRLVTKYFKRLQRSSAAKQPTPALFVSTVYKHNSLEISGGTPHAYTIKGTH